MTQHIARFCLFVLCLLLGKGVSWGQDTDWKQSIVLCTSETDLVAGGTYYIGTTATKEGPFMANYTSGYNFPMFPNGSNKLCELKLGGDKIQGWTFSYTYNEKTFYLDPTNTNKSGNLKASVTVPEYGKFAISFEDYRAIILVDKGDLGRFTIRYNSSNQNISCISINSTQQNNPIYLYKQVSEVPSTATITIAAACTDGNTCYSTYSNASAWVVPGDLTVSTIGIDSNGLLVVTPYHTDDVVAANTGVMVAGEAGNHTITLTNATATTAPGTNNLHPSGNAGITAAEMADLNPNCCFYRLTMHNGTQIGFWWGAADGAAFSLAANKAYLAVPKSAGSNANTGMWVNNHLDPTRVVLAPEKTHGTNIYTPQGQRLTHMQTGVNIVNGKKIIR